MKQCPYNRQVLGYVRKLKNDLVDETSGIIRSQTETVQETYQMMACVEENCGVWEDGKCRYNKG